MAANTDGTIRDNAHYVRITSGGRIKLWVEFSLKFLEVSPH